MSRNMVFVALALLTAGLAGCTGTADADRLTIAFTATDDDVQADKDPQLLADFLAQATGREVDIHWVQSSQAAIEAMRGGHADVGFFDGTAAWFAWQRFGFEAIAADVNDDGRSHYVAAAWVRAESGTTSMAELEGMRSCHTGLLKSAGMFMPLGWLIGEGLVDVQGPDDDITSIEPTVRAFFSEASIPDAGPYAGYAGALRCLSEDAGDVAFIKDTTPTTYCGQDAPAWCLPVGSYAKIQEFGRVPSHPVMVRGDLDEATRQDVQEALLSLGASAEGQAILDEVLETEELVAVTSEEHLGEFGARLAHVPGIQSYVDAKLK